MTFQLNSEIKKIFMGALALINIHLNQVIRG